MTAPERFADSQIPLAPRAPSIHDPSETSTGRASPCRNNISGPTGAGALERDVQMAPAEVSPKRFRWAALSLG